MNKFQKVKFLFFIILYLINIDFVYPNHAVGGELYYQCQGNGNYLVTFILYKDCQTGSPGNSTILSLTNACGYPDQLITLNLISSGNYVNENCNAFTGCFGGSTLGIEKLFYQNTITINNACQSWNLIVATASRSGLITTVNNPDNYDLCVMASINNLNNICDNSPVISNEPLAIVCNNEPYFIDIAATDVDNDSLAYHLIPPKSDSATNIPYNTPLTFAGFMDSNPPIIFDSLNGKLYFTSTQTQVTIYAIRIEEYRNGLLIGYVERDMILYTYNCSPSSPLLSGINGGNSDSLHICAYRPNCFSIQSFDPDITDSTRISWDNTIPGLTMTSSGTQNDSVQFCWTPSFNDINSAPHILNVFAWDNSCAANQVFNRKYYLTVDDTTSNNCSFTSVNETGFKINQLLIYPQPAHNRFYIDCGNLWKKHQLILTIKGIRTEVLYTAVLTSKLTAFDATNILQPGLYFVVVEDPSNKVTGWAKILVASEY